MLQARPLASVEELVHFANKCCQETLTFTGRTHLTDMADNQPWTFSWVFFYGFFDALKHLYKRISPRSVKMIQILKFVAKNSAQKLLNAPVGGRSQPKNTKQSQSSL